MTHEEIKKEIIAHLDEIAKMHPFSLLKDDKHYMLKNGHIGHKENIYEYDGHTCNY